MTTASNEKSWASYLEADQNSGLYVVKGTAILAFPLGAMLNMQMTTVQEVRDIHPDLSSEEIHACIQYATAFAA